MDYLNFIKPNAINIFSKEGCKYCKMIISDLEEISAKTNIINVSKFSNEQYEKFMQPLKNTTQHNTFPFVFINDKFIGGYTEMHNMISLGFIFDQLEQYNVEYDKSFSTF